MKRKLKLILSLLMLPIFGVSNMNAKNKNSKISKSINGRGSVIIGTAGILGLAYCVKKLNSKNRPKIKDKDTNKSNGDSAFPTAQTNNKLKIDYTEKSIPTSFDSIKLNGFVQCGDCDSQVESVIKCQKGYSVENKRYFVLWNEGHKNVFNNSGFPIRLFCHDSTNKWYMKRMFINGDFMLDGDTVSGWLYKSANAGNQNGVKFVYPDWNTSDCVANSKGNIEFCKQQTNGLAEDDRKHIKGFG